MKWLLRHSKDNRHGHLYRWAMGPAEVMNWSIVAVNNGDGWIRDERFIISALTEARDISEAEALMILYGADDARPRLA